MELGYVSGHQKEETYIVFIACSFWKRFGFCQILNTGSVLELTGWHDTDTSLLFNIQ